MKNLTILRERNHYSRKQMAEFLHVTVQTYSCYEEGLREPSLETLHKIADILHCSLDDLTDINVLDTSLKIKVKKDYRTKKPRVYIVESEPKLNKVNAKILEKYLSIIISDIDFSQNVKEQINKKIKENENFKKISNE